MCTRRQKGTKVYKKCYHKSPTFPRKSNSPPLTLKVNHFRMIIQCSIIQRRCEAISSSRHDKIALHCSLAGLQSNANCCEKTYCHVLNQAFKMRFTTHPNFFFVMLFRVNLLIRSVTFLVSR